MYDEIKINKRFTMTTAARTHNTCLGPQDKPSALFLNNVNVMGCFGKADHQMGQRESATFWHISIITWSGPQAVSMQILKETVPLVKYTHNG